MGPELDYCLVKELWTVVGNRIAVRFAYDYREDSGQWFRADGNETWRVDADGLTAARFAHSADIIRGAGP